MRFNCVANLHFGVPLVGKHPFTRSASKMSRLFVADEHRDNEKQFVLHADEKLTAFVELNL